MVEVPFVNMENEKKTVKNVVEVPFCAHGKWKTLCKECDGSKLCKAPLCEVVASNPRYDGYCRRCCMFLRPDIPIARNYKSKENEVASRIKELFPSFVQDTIISGGCSKRRPDLFLDKLTHIIIIEIDEDKHSSYDSSCENRRLMEYPETSIIAPSCSFDSIQIVI